MQLPKLDSATFHLLEQKKILFDMLNLKVSLMNSTPTHFPYSNLAYLIVL